MDVHDKVNFANALFRDAKDLKKRNDPDAVPATVIKLHDEAGELNNWLCRSGKHVDPRTLWVVAKMAQILDDIAALSARLQAVEAFLGEDDAPTLTAENKEPQPLTCADEKCVVAVTPPPPNPARAARVRPERAKRVTPTPEASMAGAS